VKNGVATNGKTSTRDQAEHVPRRQPCARGPAASAAHAAVGVPIGARACSVVRGGGAMRADARAVADAPLAIARRHALALMSSSP
jgi:hypothetical protein